MRLKSTHLAINTFADSSAVWSGDHNIPNHQTFGCCSLIQSACEEARKKMLDRETDDIQSGPLQAKGICKHVNVFVNDGLGFEKGRILVVDVSALHWG